MADPAREPPPLAPGQGRITSTDPAGGRAPGPWVLVVGMHRSNTSALTGMLAGLGLALPPEWDLLTGNPDNPTHFESRSLVELDDALLAALDGRWDDPPVMRPGWQDEPGITSFDDRALGDLRRVYGTPGPKVWKDPRLCLLLPYWLRLLEGPAAAVFVWRTPGEVADSLHRREGSTLSHGLALWAAYNRSALAALEGRAVHVVESGDLLDTPTATAEALAAWLDTQGIQAPVRGWDVERAAAVIAPELVRRGGPDSAAVPSECIAMADQLHTLSGSHAALAPVDLGPLPTWATDAIDDHRCKAVARQQRAEQEWAAHLLRLELQDVERKRSELERQRAELERRYFELGDANHQLAIDHSAANEELLRLQSEVADLRHQRDVARDQSDRVELELERIRASVSWRITAPLRSIRRAGPRSEEPAG